MPIFKNFIKNAVKKKDARPFKVAKNIKMMVVDQITGKKANFLSEKTIIEAYKKNKLENKDFNSNYDLDYKLNKKNILKFY